jgi:hypothetical protein
MKDHWPGIEHIFVICNKHHEPLQYKHIREQMKQHNIPSQYVTFWSPTFGQLTDAQRKEFKIAGCTKGEQSLLYNYHSLAKHIVNKWKENPSFLFLEADVCFLEIERMESFLDWKPKHFHMISVGGGDKTRDGNKAFSLQQQTDLRCCDGIIWSREGLVQMLKSESVSKPLDWHLKDKIAEMNLIQYWTFPSIMEQGSKNGMFDSTLEEGRREEGRQRREVTIAEDSDEEDTPVQPENTKVVIGVFTAAAVVMLCLCLFFIFSS